MHDHYFYTTPGATVIFVIDEADHRIILSDDHWQRGDTQHRIILIHAGEILWKRNSQKHVDGRDSLVLTYHTDTQPLPVDRRMHFQESLNCPDHSSVLSIIEVIR